VPEFSKKANAQVPIMTRFFKISLLLAGLAVVSGLVVVPDLFGNIGENRTLKFYHTHTGKVLKVTYYQQGEYDPEALAMIRVYLADWRDGKQQDLDPELMDILWRIQLATGNANTWEVISAYRSPQTNEMLRSRSSGVAKKSQHLVGSAIDVRLRGLELEVLRDTARSLKLGGVGYYPGSDFVHVDTGRVRYW
jgi:uncharacterized protein YcbK (DUF882 family)